MSIRPFYLPGEGSAPAVVEISAQVIGTSADMRAVAIGALALTTQGNRQWTPAATRLRVASRSEGTAWMDGAITSYDTITGALVVNVDAVGDYIGAPLGDWSISLTGEPGAATNLADIPTTVTGTDTTQPVHSAGVRAATIAYFAGLPTSDSGLSVGDFYWNGGVLCRVEP